MTSARVNLERSRVIHRSAQDVWRWMCDPDGLSIFHINPFHGEATCTEPRLKVGSQVRINHTLGLWREMRIARIVTIEPFVLAWGEVKEHGQDWFPHDQRFSLTAQGEGRCLLTNRLRGAFNLPAARWWLMPWYTHFASQLLQLENRKIAKATEPP